LAFILEGSGVDLIARKFQPAGLVAYDNQKGAISCWILALVQIGYLQLVLVEAGGCSLNYQEVAAKVWQIDVHRECAAETRQAVRDQRPSMSTSAAITKLLPVDPDGGAGGSSHKLGARSNGSRDQKG
jgi:hypothetical protein